MLHLYQGNRLERLSTHLCGLLAGGEDDPFQTEQIVVADPGMGRWLALQIADEIGICANLEFPLPAAFIWRFLNQWLPEIPAENPYAPDVLSWRILDFLLSSENRKGFRPVEDYLQHQDSFGQLELAQQIAHCFDSYLVYRPDWILKWEEGKQAVKGEDWQPLLWCGLRQKIGYEHWAGILRRLDSRYRRGEEMLGDRLPARVFLFGLSAVSPGYLQLIQWISEYTEVHLYLLNPCQEFWGDILAPGKIEQLKLLQTSDESLYLEVGNPLLASWGGLGQQLFSRLLELNPQTHELFQEIQPDTLLRQIQQDVLQLNDPEKNPPYSFDPSDRSIQVHSCHSAMREVEVLLDLLRDCLESLPDLRPDEILVLTPDMDSYAPYIEAIFGSQTLQPVIPYGIADRSPLSGDRLLNGFLDLLTLPGSRYENQRLFDLLSLPAIYRRLGLQEEDLDELKAWIIESGIRWGIDKRSSDADAASKQNSWRFGLDRLLLGYALPGDGKRLYQGILPHGVVEGSAGVVLGALVDFASAVFALEEDLAGECTIEQWCVRLNGLLERFFLVDEDEQASFLALRQVIERLSVLSKESHFTHKVNLNLILGYLRQQLEASASRGRFLGQGVTFSTLTPVRTLPYRVIALIGMNDGSFPRQNRWVDFDLLRTDYRPGDRSRRMEDLNLFLELLISARDCLLISYTGQHQRENMMIPPSVIISELYEYIKQNIRDETLSIFEKNCCLKHPLQPFNPEYFVDHSQLYSYSKSFADIASALQKTPVSGENFFDNCSVITDEKLNEVIDLKTLFDFFSNPVRYLLRQRIGLQLETGQTEMEPHDPMEIPFFERRALLETSSRDLLAGGWPEQLRAVWRGTGQLPHGHYGDYLFDRVIKQAEKIANEIEPYLIEPVAPCQLECKVAGFRLTGHLDDLYRRGIFVQTDKVRGRYLLLLWIKHLLLCIARPDDVEPVTRCLADKTLHRLMTLDAEQAKSHLEQLMTLFRQGCQSPLMLFPNSSHVYMEAVNNGKNKEYAMQKAVVKWVGNDYVFGESQDPYYQFAFRYYSPLGEDFVQMSRQVFEPILTAWEKP